MKNGMCILTFAVLIILTGFVVSFADSCHTDDANVPAAAQTKTEKAKAIEVGNITCPVMGEKINPEYKATYEYEGKVYNFCCAGCLDEFKKDPAKYIKKVEEEMEKAANVAAEAVSHEGHSHSH